MNPFLSKSITIFFSVISTWNWSWDRNGQIILFLFKRTKLDFQSVVIRTLSSVLSSVQASVGSHSGSSRKSSGALRQSTQSHCTTDNALSDGYNNSTHLLKLQRTLNKLIFLKFLAQFLAYLQC